MDTSTGQIEAQAQPIGLLSIKQMAAEMGIAEMSLYKRRSNGDFPASYKIGGTIRVDRRDFLTWLESKREVA